MDNREFSKKRRRDESDESEESDGRGQSRQHRRDRVPTGSSNFLRESSADSNLLMRCTPQAANPAYQPWNLQQINFNNADDDAPQQQQQPQYQPDAEKAKEGVPEKIRKAILKLLDKDENKDGGLTVAKIQEAQEISGLGTKQQIYDALKSLKKASKIVSVNGKYKINPDAEKAEKAEKAKKGDSQEIQKAILKLLDMDENKDGGLKAAKIQEAQEISGLGTRQEISDAIKYLKGTAKIVFVNEKYKINPDAEKAKTGEPQEIQEAILKLLDMDENKDGGLTRAEIREAQGISGLGTETQISTAIEFLKNASKIVSVNGKYKINPDAEKAKKGEPPKIQKAILKLLDSDENKDGGLKPAKIQEAQGISGLGTRKQISNAIISLKNASKIVSVNGKYKINPDAEKAKKGDSQEIQEAILKLLNSDENKDGGLTSAKIKEAQGISGLGTQNEIFSAITSLKDTGRTVLVNGKYKINPDAEKAKKGEPEEIQKAILKLLDSDENKDAGLKAGKIKEAQGISGLGTPRQISHAIDFLKDASKIVSVNGKYKINPDAEKAKKGDSQEIQEAILKLLDSDENKDGGLTVAKIQEAQEISGLGTQDEIDDAITSLTDASKIVLVNGKYKINPDAEKAKKGEPEEIQKAILKLLDSDENKDGGLTRAKIKQAQGISGLGTKEQIDDAIDFLKNASKIVSVKGKYKINPDAEKAKKGDSQEIQKAILKLLNSDENKDGGLTSAKIKEAQGISGLGTQDEIDDAITSLKNASKIVSVNGKYKSVSATLLVSNRNVDVEREKKKQEIANDLRSLLPDKKVGEKTEKDEYINSLMDLWNQNSSEFQGFELLDLPKTFENKDFLKLTKTLLGKERRTVKPFNHEGSQETKMPMLLTLLARETKDSVNTFLETCVGTGQFLLQAPYEHFVVADVEKNITNFLKVVKDDPHNLEILGRVIKAYLKKRPDINTKDWKERWSEIWKETLKRVKNENEQPLSEAYDGSKSVQKALAFILYRNAKSISNNPNTRENFKEKINDTKIEPNKNPHQNAYRSQDMKVMINQLDKIPETEIITQDMIDLLKNQHSNKDLIYIDPPYVLSTYDSQQAGISVGGYAKSISNEEQIEVIQELGKIIKQKSDDKTGDKPITIGGYCNHATLDIVKECIENGAAKIYLFPLPIRGGRVNLEMFAIFKPTTQTNSQELQTPDQEKIEQRKNLFHQMQEGEENNLEPEKDVIKHREWLWVQLGYLKNQLVALYKYDLSKFSENAPIHKAIKNLHKERHLLMKAVSDMRRKSEKDADIIKLVADFKTKWHNELDKIAEQLKYSYPDMKEKVNESKKKKKNNKVYFTPEWEEKQPLPSGIALSTKLTSKLNKLDINSDAMEIDWQDTTFHEGLSRDNLAARLGEKVEKIDLIAQQSNLSDIDPNGIQWQYDTIRQLYYPMDIYLKNLQPYMLENGDEYTNKESNLRFQVGAASGVRNQCLLDTFAQLLTQEQGQIVTIDQLSNLLITNNIIAPDQMIDVHDRTFGEFMSTTFNVSFLVHEVTTQGVMEGPVMGAGVTTLHIMYDGLNHFVPLFPD